MLQEIPPNAPYITLSMYLFYRGINSNIKKTAHHTLHFPLGPFTVTPFALPQTLFVTFVGTFLPFSL